MPQSVQWKCKACDKLVDGPECTNFRILCPYCGGGLELTVAEVEAVTSAESEPEEHPDFSAFAD